MKTIALVSDSKVKNNRPNIAAISLTENLKEVFGDTVDVHIYYIDELRHDSVLDEDLTLILAGSRAVKIRDLVINKDNIILAGRTFLKGGLEQLYKIPEGSDVLVVNDNIETILDCVSSLYNIGIKHVNLIPFDPNKEFRHISYAISPSEMDLIPSYIPKTYNVYSRVMDISTMLLIMSRLAIDGKDIQQRLYHYYQKIFSVNESVTENYNNLLKRTEELDYLLDLSHDGIVLTDSEGLILVHNQKFNNLFDLNGKIDKQYLHDIVPSIDIKPYYKIDYHSDVLNFNNKHLHLEKRNIVHFNNEKRIYFSFQEVTHIKKLEQNLSQKLRQKGHIAKYHFDDIVTCSPLMKDIIKRSQQISKTDLTVLITGESGTGKEVLAQAIHNASERKSQPFIAINGSAIPENLLESELFGYVSGSFTGALKQGKKGLFELANNGTLFLDEIGDMPIHLQAKLLRVLQERQITPVGSDQIIEIDVRVIAATFKNPLELIEEGKFRKDLFYRLNVFPIDLPPLKNRMEDIPILLHAFTHHKYHIADDCLKHFTSYAWPGNVRELHNIANYINIVETSDTIGIRSLPQYIIDQTDQLSEVYTADHAHDKIVIETLSDLDTSLNVLGAIAFLNDIKQTAGRKHILAFLDKKRTPLAEGTLRKTLNILESQDLIIIKKGRSGSYITSKGLLFLKEHHK